MMNCSRLIFVAFHLGNRIIGAYKKQYKPHELIIVEFKFVDILKF